MCSLWCWNWSCYVLLLIFLDKIYQQRNDIGTILTEIKIKTIITTHPKCKLNMMMSMKKIMYPAP